MQTHTVFTSLVLHSNEELEEILQTQIRSRETIHAWPLSSVEQLTLDNGTEWIYKSQLPPTVEPEFYQQATSVLLPAHRYLGKKENCEVMLIEKIHAPLLSTINPSAITLLEHGRRIMAAVAELGDRMPVYLNIGSANAWLETVEILLGKLGKLIIARRFRLINVDSVERLRTWAMSDKICELVVNHSHLAHGDLKAEQVFVARTGYRVIDWQRPMIAPPGIDLVALLVSQQIDPLQYVDAAVTGVFWFLRLRWAVVAQSDLFPEKRWPLFESWAKDAIAHILER